MTAVTIWCISGKDASVFWQRRLSCIDAEVSIGRVAGVADRRRAGSAIYFSASSDKFVGAHGHGHV